MNHESTATTRDDLCRWFDGGVAQGAAYLVIVTDTLHWEDYPVYIFPDENASALVKERQTAGLSGVMEVYDLNADRDQQLDAQRVWAIDSPEPIQFSPLVHELVPDLVTERTIEFLRTPRRRL